MLLFKPSRTWLHLLFLVSFFAALFFFPKKALAANPYTTTGSFSGATTINLGQTRQYSVQFSDVDNDLLGGSVTFYYARTDSPYPRQWNTIGIYPPQFSYGETASVSWTPQDGVVSPGTYYVTANVLDNNADGNPNNGCSGNPWCPINGGTDPNCSANWTACNYTGGVNYDMMTVTVQNAPPPESPSTINPTPSIEPRHRIYDICQTLNPDNPETHLLTLLRVYMNVTINPNAEGFNSFRIYVSRQAGEFLSPNVTAVVDGGLNWWRTNPIPITGSGNVAGDIRLYGSPGLQSGSKTVKVVLFKDAGINSCEACGTYGKVQWQTPSPVNVDRNAPNYSSSYAPGSCTYQYPGTTNCALKLRLEKPGGTIITNPVGTLGESVILRPYSVSDTGGFNVDRVDLWVAWKDGDAPVSVGCAPEPPYTHDPDNFGYCPGPMNCQNFTLGAYKAWYIGCVGSYAPCSSGSVPWNTNGFATGTRNIVANIFDNPTGRQGQNIMTYTGNSGDPNSYFARIDYNLTLPISPWIKTVGGDVHSNTGISATGGP